ncbi:MAG: CotH kinase family protein [Myxococcota bacterium]
MTLTACGDADSSGSVQGDSAVAPEESDGASSSDVAGGTDGAPSESDDASSDPVPDGDLDELQGDGLVTEPDTTTVEPEPEPESEAPSGPSADQATPYFDPERVLNVDIEMRVADWIGICQETRTLADILGGDCLDGPPEQKFEWRLAKVTVDGVTVDKVGIRKKGYLGSMSDTKPSLKIRFDKYEDQFLEDGEGGSLKWLTLNNVQQDRSKLNTCMAYHVFALAGRPAPRCNFAKVTVNGQALGLYVHVESVKDAFIAHHFDDATGNLYEGTLSDFREIWSNTFEKKSNATEADWSDIEGVTEALADSSPAGLEALADVVDLDLFMTHWALEVLVGHWDGYAGNRNNFFVYGPSGSPLTFIPWGPDSSFTPIDNAFIDGAEPQSVMAHGGLAHRLYQDPTTRAQYIARMLELLDAIWDEVALNAEIDRMAAIVQAHAGADAAASAVEDTQRLRDFVNGRRAVITNEMNGGGISWDMPLAEPNICWEVLGTIDVDFESTWGTSEVEDFMGVGGAVINDYEFMGETLTFTDSGVTSGHGEGFANVAIIHSEPTGAFDVISLYVPYAQFSSGDVKFDGWSPPGHRIRFAPPAWQPEYLGRVDFVDGWLNLDEASLVDGATVSGNLRATIYGFGGYVSGSGSKGVVTADNGLVLNEVAAKGEPLDWIELHNTSAVAIDLSTFVVADNLTLETERVAFPEGTVVAPGGYLVVEFDKDGWPGFALGADEEVGIWTADGVLIDSANWSTGFSGDNATYARIPDATGPFVPGSSPTPGTSND